MAGKEIFIDLNLQRIYAIEDGQRVFGGRVSTGKQGHETPTGSFKILQKKRKHISNLYPEPDGGSEMPYMMRLTWDGIAMHQGYVSKQPSSHGCIRLHRRLAQKLFKWASKGTPVNIAGDTSRYERLNTNYSTNYAKDEDGYSIIEVY